MRIPPRLHIVLVLVSVFVVSRASVIRGQGDGWTPAYPFILTPERAEAFVEAADRRLPYVPGEVVVKFKPGVTTSGQQRALMALRSRPDVSALRWSAGAAVLRDESQPDSTVLAAQLRSQPEVEYAEPNYIRRANSSPNDPGFSGNQWNLTAIDMPKAWDLNAGATNKITVAVIDSGITTTDQTFVFRVWDGRSIQNVSVPFAVSPDLAGARHVTPVDLVFWNGPVLDTEGHGTHVASTIGEDTNNDLAEAGIAYNVKIMPVKVCLTYWDIQFIRSGNGIPGFAPLDSGGCSSDAVAAGIRYAADNGAKIINISLGGPGASTQERDALTYAVSKGAFVVISGGNEYEDGNEVDYPAGFATSIEGVMSVGAVGKSLKRAFYSNTGSQIEIVAPGGDHRDGGTGGEIWQTTVRSSDNDPLRVTFPRFDRYSETAFEGTSMAAPHVGGIAALIMSQGVTSPAAIEALIRKTARDLGPAGRDDEYGYGLVQPRPALFGFGLGR
jgi:serine protease